MPVLKVDSLTDVQSIAIALERVCRAANALLDAVARLEPVDVHVRPLEEALAASGQDTHTHMLWARDVLDGKIPVRNPPQRKKETFEQLRKRASEVNVFVHFVHTFEGSEYAIYTGTHKVAHAKTMDRCTAIMRSLVKKGKRNGAA